MTEDEYKVHMTMWAAMKSPLIMGTDIRSLTQMLILFTLIRTSLPYLKIQLELLSIGDGDIT